MNQLSHYHTVNSSGFAMQSPYESATARTMESLAQQAASQNIFIQGIQRNVLGHQLKRLALRAAVLQGVYGITAEQQGILAAENAQATAQAAIGKGRVRKYVQGSHQSVITWS